MGLLATGRTRLYFCGGLGSGKTHTGAQAFLALILANREWMQAHGRDGPAEYIVGAPKEADLKKGTMAAIREVLDIWQRHFGFSLIKRWAKSAPFELQLVTGDIISFHPLDAGNLKAINACGAWWDEAEECEDTTLSRQLMQARLRSNRVPKLVMLVTSTPGTEGQGVLAHWEEQIAAGDNDYAVVRASTASNPAHAGTDYYAKSAAGMSKREVASRLDGRPQPPSGTVYGREWSDADSVARWHTWLTKTPDLRPRLKTHEYWWAIDWGSHFSALLIEHDPRTGIDVIIDEHHEDGCQDTEFLSQLDSVLRFWQLTRADIRGVWCDAQPKTTVELARTKYYRGKVFYRRMDEQRKKARIATLRWRLDPGDGQRLFFIAPHLVPSKYERGFIPAIKNYTHAERRVGGTVVQLDRVRQDHWSSHACDAASYFVYGRYGHLRSHDKKSTKAAAGYYAAGR